MFVVFSGWLPSPLLPEGATEKKLDLGIDAPHVVVGPTPQGGENLRVDSKEESVTGRQRGALQMHG